MRADEARRDHRHRVQDLVPPRDHQLGEELLQPLVQPLGARAEARVVDPAQDERAQQTAPLVVHADLEGHALAHDRADRRPGPTRLLERGLRGGERLLDEALVERDEQRVLVAEARVERAHRRARAARDLGDPGVLPRLLGEDRLGRIEDPRERQLAARLLRRADPDELGNWAGGVVSWGAAISGVLLQNPNSGSDSEEIPVGPIPGQEKSLDRAFSAARSPSRPRSCRRAGPGGRSW